MPPTETTHNSNGHGPALVHPAPEERAAEYGQEQWLAAYRPLLKAAEDLVLHLNAGRDPRFIACQISFLVRQFGNAYKPQEGNEGLSGVLDFLGANIMVMVNKDWELRKLIEENQKRGVIATPR